MMDRGRFFAAVRGSLFGGRLTEAQVRGMELKLDAFAAVGDGRAKTLGYGLATGYHETGARMVPVREGFASSDAEARRIVASRRYGKPVPPYGQVYYGRGDVQLTWADNYRDSSAEAGVDLLANPDAMLDPAVSARILWLGLQDGRWNKLGLGIAHYLPDAGPDDLQGARRTVNVTDRWQLIAGYHRRFMAAIELAGYAPPQRAPERPVESIPPTEAVGEPEMEMAIQRLAQWRAEAPAAALAATTDWIGRMPA